ncbi:MAG: EamA family transporter [Bacteroidetes bacterium]|jgi:drug/metabolite transporter (DMT)-like permease|nr:EamA family transporter [Bacteroidota bacterium]
MTSSKQLPAAFDWGLLAFLGLIWGTSFFGVELSLDSLPPLSIAAGRIVFAAVLLVGVAYAMGDGLPATATPTDRRIWLHCFGMGMFTNAIPFSLLSWGQQLVTSGFAGITMAVVPLLVLPLSHYLVPGERLTRAKMVGFLIGFGGVILLIGGEKLFTGMAPGPMMFTAQLACALASCCYACGSIITRLCPPVSTLSFAAAGLLCAAVVLVPLALIIDGVPQAVSTTSMMGIFYLGLFPTGLATILLTILIKRAGPPFLSLVNYQVPIWAVLIGVIILGEALPGHFVTALIIILCGLALSQFYDRWKVASAK